MIAKKIKIIIFLLITALSIPTFVQATNKIIESEMNALNLSSFIQEGKKYTKEIFKDVDIEELLNSAVSGNLKTDRLYINILKLFGKEVASSITILGGVLAIIIINSILKNIAENIGNTSVAQIAYYVEFIIIVTLVMTSFNEVINMVNETIVNLVTYINILIPLLLSLITASGTAITATTLQPIILAIIVFIGNGINLYVLPILIISLVLGIVSNISDKIQIKKLSNMLQSSIIWVIGFIFTLFVSILSLQGTLTSSVDGLTIKGLKTVSSTFIPVVGKVLGDSVETVLRSNFCYKKCCWCSGNSSCNRYLRRTYY